MNCLFQATEPLRGCMRNININDEYINRNINKRQKIFGVGQCFANVQPGTYFPGDAYAIYSK